MNYQKKIIQQNNIEIDEDHFEKVCALSKLFKLPSEDKEKHGELIPITLTEGQKWIFYSIVTREFNRVICLTPTRYGKSRIVAIATLLRILSNPNEKWVIVAPTEPKAKIIMNYIKQHLFDQEDFIKMVPKSFTDSREKLRHERSQKRITLLNGSSIEILSADADTKLNAGQKLMGMGTPNLIIDESCELSDEIYSKAFRMLGDSKDNFLIELGNPWYRNHFYKASTSDKYLKVLVDYVQALEEGRYTQQFIDEMRENPNFSILMECKFPDADSIDAQGYLPIFSDTLIKIAQRDEVPFFSGRKILGLDISYKGKDSNVWVVRTDNAMEMVYKTHDENPNNIIAITIELCKKLGIRDTDVYMDATGGGNILYQRFLEVGFNVHGIGFNDKPFDVEKFRDIKSEGFFNLYTWLSRGGLLISNPGWNQLLDIKYKVNSGKVHIISKDELRKQGISSPDIADAAMLTCVAGIDNYNINKEYEVKNKRINQPKYE